MKPLDPEMAEGRALEAVEAATVAPTPGRGDRRTAKVVRGGFAPAALLSGS
jgi:hypothetical protein